MATKQQVLGQILLMFFEDGHDFTVRPPRHQRAEATGIALVFSIGL
jgi:hypothetical protein